MNWHARSRHFWALLAVLLLPATGAWAQAGGGTSAPTKIAIINVQQAIVTTGEGKQASAQLNVQFTPRQNELENIQKQIQDLQTRLNNGARTLSEDEKARLQRQGELLTRDFQRRQEGMSEEVTAAQGEIVDTIGRKMFEIIDRYARENGYALVLNASAQGTPVIYASNQVDITAEIIRLYDQAHPIKAAAAPPAAATPPAAAPKR